MHIEIYQGESLAECLSALGVPCTFKSEQITCRSVKYHFDLKNLKQLHEVGNVLDMLSAHLHVPVKQLTSNSAHFCLEILREQREYPRFMAHHEALKNKPTGEILFGIDDNGEPVTNNILKTKSILIAGSSGGGKSVLLSNIICSLACYSHPSQLSMTLIDLKRCEFSMFKNLGHLNHEIVKDYNMAIQVLRTVKSMVQQRYEEMEKEGIRKATPDKYPIICVIIDEYAELATRGNKAELDEIIASISATGRACNVFLIIATQHAVNSVISNKIKSNMQTKIGLRTTNVAQSIVAIGSRDCVDLLGNGDCYIYFDGTPSIQRVQVCELTDEDIHGITCNLPPRVWNTPTTNTTPQPRKSTWLDKLLGLNKNRQDSKQKNKTSNPVSSKDNSITLDEIMDYETFEDDDDEE